jgi:hypothetical protein
MPSSPGGFPTSRRPSGAALVSRDRSREWLPAPFPFPLMGPPPLPSPGDRPSPPLPPGGQPGPSIGFPNACPGRSCRGHAWFCRRDSTRSQNVLGSIPILPGNGFPASLMLASLAPSLSGRSAGNVQPGLSFPASNRRPGRFPEMPRSKEIRGYSEAQLPGGLAGSDARAEAREDWESPVRGRGTVSRTRLSLLAAAGLRPRPEDRPRSADPCPGDRSLRGIPSLRAMPAAARRLILASQGHARTGSLRFFDPLPPHVGLSRLLRGAWRARGRLPSASPPRRRFPSPALRRDPGKPRLSPGRPAACSRTLQSGKSQRRSRIC